MACQDTTPILKEKTERVRVDTSSLPLSTRLFLFAKLRCWYRYSVPRVLLSEGNAVLQRIRWIREIHAVEHLGGRDSTRAWLVRESVPWCPRYTPVYIRYMQQIESQFPFLSIFDLHLVSQAWKAGLEYGIRTYTEQNQDRSCDQFS